MSSPRAHPSLPPPHGGTSVAFSHGLTANVQQRATTEKQHLSQTLGGGGGALGGDGGGGGGGVVSVVWCSVV